MRHLECSDCRSSVRVANTFNVNGEVLCEPCADKKVVEAQKAKGKLVVFRGKDPTICFKCSTDFGAQELPLLAGLHVCETCRQSILDFHYPAWLRTAAVALLALLVLSLFHGRSYFVAGQAYYKGKKLLDSGNAQGAVPYFEEALKVAVNSPEVAGNAALAYLKSGQPDPAYKVVKGQSFKNDDLYRTLTAEFDRWDRAATKADEAGKLYGESKYKEAAQRMHEAASAYPAFLGFEVQATVLDSSVAFSNGDYATMVRLSETLWTKDPGYYSAAALAGAYACVYASGGDETVKQKAMDTMAKAKTLVSSKEQQEDFQEWEPRFSHRIQTRQILTRDQYDALFRREKKTQEERQ